jgi:hypothetical protein
MIFFNILKNDIFVSEQHGVKTGVPKRFGVRTRYDYNLTIMKSPKPATDNRFKK